MLPIDAFTFMRMVTEPLALGTGRAQALAPWLRASRVMQNGAASEGIDGIHVTDHGVAVIPVSGLLTNQKSGPAFMPGATRYGGIADALSVALSSPEVTAVAFDVDSGGGEVPGLFDLADSIHAARGKKPMWAILSGDAVSAAYALASAADKVIVPRASSTGGIGLVALHFDLSKAMGEAGVTVNAISFGKAKTDGLPFFPMTAAARTRFQAEIDMIGNLFVQTVARNRGLTPKAVRAWDGGTFLGRDGVRAGLADAVSSPEAAMQAFAGLARELRNKTPALRVAPGRARIAPPARRVREGEAR